MKNQFLQHQIAYVLLLLTIIGGGCRPAQEQQESASADRPNFIFYLADDQPKANYGCYGNEKVYTPGVDRLASEGMLFQKAYTPQAICAPSRSVLYTGNFPIRNGCFMNHMPLRQGQESLVNKLKALGYKVILAGKSHVSPDSAFDWTENWKSINDENLEGGGQASRLPLDKITQFIREETEPYCLILASALPHGPLPKVETLPKEEIKLMPHMEQNEKSYNSMSAWYENIRRDNAQLEVILNAVDEADNKENILFAYASDHGTNGGKFTVSNLGLNIPMVIRWPKVIQKATTSDALVNFADILPTFIELAGGEVPAGIDGMSFKKVLTENAPSPRKYTYGVAEHQNIWIPSIFPSRMVTDGKWKYVRHENAYEVHEKNFGDDENINAFIRLGAEKFKDKPFEALYNVEEDPFEQNNLIDDSSLAEIKQRLSNELFRWMKSQGDYLAEGSSLPIFKPNHGHLDKENKLYHPPKALINSLKNAEYRMP